MRLHEYQNQNSNGVKLENGGNSPEVESVFYDEIVFNEPNEEFFKVLIAKPGYLLPSNKSEKAVFSKQLEQEEIDRISDGAKKVDEEIEKLKEELTQMIQT